MLTTKREHWDDKTFSDILFTVQERVHRNSSVVEEDDPLKDWLDKFRFFLSQNKDFTFAKNTAILTTVPPQEE